MTTTSLDDVLRCLATTTRRTRRTTRSTSDGDVAGVSRTTNARRRCPSCMGWRGGTRTWDDDAAAAVATTTIAALLSLSSSDHRSGDHRRRHSSPPDPSHRMPSSARIDVSIVNRDCTSNIDDENQDDASSLLSSRRNPNQRRQHDNNDDDGHIHNEDVLPRLAPRPTPPPQCCG